MRVLHAAALTVVALLTASVGSAQGLGDVAAREREKRKATPAQPAKVYTESDIGRAMAPVAAEPDLPAAVDEAGEAGSEGQPPAEGEAAEGEATEGEATEGEATEGEAVAAAPAGPSAAEAARIKAEEEARAQAEEAWRRRLDQARKEEAVYKDVIAKLQLELDDTTGGFYNPGRAAKIAFQDENKQKLAETQGRIAALEEEGRRNNYR
jgi:fused signal recognition particle receptor